MRRKVLLFFEYGTLNGGEFSLLSMLEAWGHGDLEFVAAAPPSGRLQARLAQGGIDVVPLILRDDQDRKRPLADIHTHLLDCVARVAPSLIHANSLAMGRMVGRLAADLAIPCTAHLRDIITLNKTATADLNRHTGLIAVSQATKRFHAAQGVHADLMQVITNGVDTKRFRPASARGTLRRELGLHDSALLIAQIGQICLRKGQTLLARAAVTLAGEFPEVHTLFVGERHSQKQESIDYENTLRQTFHEAGIAGRLHCLGFRDDIPALLNEIDLLVHPAHQEPLGRVLLEAAACARPIVATHVGGTPEILTDEVSALLVPPDDLDALTRAIRRLLTDPELRMRLGHQARIGIKEKFALPMAAARVRAFWESFL
jgi:glycosyltransferase involved in cell wall biosynthesis